VESTGGTTEEMMMCVHLAGLMPFISKRLTKKHAVLVDGLRAVRGDAPVRGELRLFAVELVEAEGRIGVADIESEQHLKLFR
jgi:hypothetical protein